MFDIEELVPDLQGPGEVEVVVCPPEAGQDGGDVERSVSHDMELFPDQQSEGVILKDILLPWISLPVPDCQPLPGQYPAVDISRSKLPNSRVTKDLGSSITMEADCWASPGTSRTSQLGS